jgi:hypothetical protein
MFGAAHELAFYDEAQSYFWLPTGDLDWDGFCKPYFSGMKNQSVQGCIYSVFAKDIPGRITRTYKNKYMITPHPPSGHPLPQGERGKT